MCVYKYAVVDVLRHEYPSSVSVITDKLGSCPSMLALACVPVASGRGRGGEPYPETGGGSAGEEWVHADRAITHRSRNGTQHTQREQEREPVYEILTRSCIVFPQQGRQIIPYMV